MPAWVEFMEDLEMAQGRLFYDQMEELFSPEFPAGTDLMFSFDNLGFEGDEEDEIDVESVDEAISEYNLWREYRYLEPHTEDEEEEEDILEVDDNEEEIDVVSTDGPRRDFVEGDEDRRTGYFETHLDEYFELDHLDEGNNGDEEDEIDVVTVDGVERPYIEGNEDRRADYFESQSEDIDVETLESDDNSDEIDVVSTDGPRRDFVEGDEERRSYNFEPQSEDDVVQDILGVDGNRDEAGNLEEDTSNDATTTATRELPSPFAHHPFRFLPQFTGQFNPRLSSQAFGLEGGAPEQLEEQEDDRPSLARWLEEMEEDFPWDRAVDQMLELVGSTSDEEDDQEDLVDENFY